MIEFAWPWMALLLPLPLLIRLLPKVEMAEQAALKLPGNLMQGLPQVQQTKARLSPWLLILAWLLLVLASTRPQWLGEAIPLPVEGREMVLAIDLSRSMQREDMQLRGNDVDRLTMLKHVMHDFIIQRKGDRLGLILFADGAYLQAPLTYDLGTVQTLMDEAVLGLVGDRTAIGDAIALAVKRFEENENPQRVLVLVTDGQNTAGALEPEQALLLAKEKQVTIYTIGVGADVMYQRSLFGTRKVNPSSDLDETLLTRLAEETGGQYFRARDTQAMEKIAQILDQLEPIEAEDKTYRPLSALYYWPLGLAFLLSLYPLVATKLRRNKHG